MKIINSYKFQIFSHPKILTCISLEWEKKLYKKDDTRSQPKFQERSLTLTYTGKHITTLGSLEQQQQVH
jgi:hypothetical protein